MKAFVVAQYGKDGIRAADVPEPKVGNGDVLVRVSAASINPLDKMIRNGEFKQLLKYKPPFVIGHDVAGVVTQVGAGVRNFKVGDEVYARPRDLRIGTFAEYIAIDQNDVALKPASLTLHEAAAVPLVALAAWQILVEKAQVKPGQKVLVHAGAGGLGSTVIQLAKHLGAHVATTATRRQRGTRPRPRSRRRRRLHQAGLLPDPLRLRPRAGLARRREPHEIAYRAQARRPGDRRRRPTRRRIRQTARRPQALRARAVVPEPQGPQGRQEARCALLVLLHAGQWCAARESSGPSTTRATSARSWTQPSPSTRRSKRSPTSRAARVKAGKVVVTLD